MKNRIRRQNRYFSIHDSKLTTVKLISGLFADVNKSFFENEEITKNEIKTIALLRTLLPLEIY